MIKFKTFIASAIIALFAVSIFANSDFSSLSAYADSSKHSQTASDTSDKKKGKKESNGGYRY